ncbi:heavy-metal-associated domain-containing protein [Leucobacter chironomi]|uniref:heavy-metal-associated domain-containing protein n=1 Tax=Leucobacter chironomi TaxID=491918 RepID=UPI0003F8C58D|nr:heavy-metal-associated domain-containing protein [Leucobacter chironomi]
MTTAPRTTDYLVTGMSCGHCEHAIRQEVTAVPGVAAVEVSAGTGLLRVEHAEQLDDAAILAAVDEAGYTAARA